MDRVVVLWRNNEMVSSEAVEEQFWSRCLMPPIVGVVGVDNVGWIGEMI